MRFPRSARLFVVAGLASYALAPVASFAQTVAPKTKLLTIPADSGYGIEECFSPGHECGKVVADAYCEAHGYGEALAFGKADDITASIVGAARPQTKGALVVNCSE